MFRYQLMLLLWPEEAINSELKWIFGIFSRQNVSHLSAKIEVSVSIWKENYTKD